MPSSTAPVPLSETFPAPSLQPSTLVSREKVPLPSLHIKLDLTKPSIKALDFEDVFWKIVSLFTRLSNAKMKVFVGPQINTVLESKI